MNSAHRLLAIRVVVVVVAFAAVAGCAFEPGVPADADVSCSRGLDCPAGDVCLVKEGTCIDLDSPCIDVSDRDARAQPDGNDCGGGSICVAAVCSPPRCGDGVVTGAETCDEGERNDDAAPDSCRTTCLPAGCGDGILDDDEECDDGPLNDDDGADACRGSSPFGTCARPGCGDAVIDSGELCDDGAGNSDVRADACRTSCLPARCGDGTRDVGEECDEGALNDDDDDDACRTTCARAACGDGVTDTSEACDDENTASGDGCRGDCAKIETCGDRVVDDDEACDDGNDNPGDGCDSCGAQTWSTALLVSGRLEGGTATGTSLNRPAGLAVDGLGRLFIADRFNRRVRRVDVDGSITVVAGIGVISRSGDGGPATSAGLGSPTGLAVDTLGRLYISDAEGSVRRVDVDGTIDTVAGTGVRGFSGDGGPATSAQLNGPDGLAVDAQGRLLIADVANDRIRRVTFDDDGRGVISTVAGSGVRGFSGDGGPATSAAFRFPSDVAVDGQGRVFVSDSSNVRVRRITFDAAGVGTVDTVVGTGTPGFSGDDGPATSAQISGPKGLAFDGAGRLFVADRNNSRVRRVTFDDAGIGTITTVAGIGGGNFSGDGGPAASAEITSPEGLAVDAAGTMFLADSGNQRVRRVTFDALGAGTIATVAGDGTDGFLGDAGPATSGLLNAPEAIVEDALGQLFVADTANNRVRRITFDERGVGTITTVAGTGAFGFSGDGGPATSAKLGRPGGVAVDSLGRVFIADRFNSRVRCVTFDAAGAGTITTIVGTGVGGFSGDGGPAADAQVGSPTGLAVDDDDQLYIADGNRIRRVTFDGAGLGTITTVAGNGTAGSAGDGGPALSAQLNTPFGVDVDGVGRLVIADTLNRRVRRVTFDAAGVGTIANVAGTGVSGFSGDGGLATSAQLALPFSASVDALGQIFIADSNNRLRRVVFDAAGVGTIDTVAGTGAFGFSGDGGPALGALFTSVDTATVGAAGDVFIAEGSSDQRIRRVAFDDDGVGTITTVVGPVHPPGPGAFDRAQLYAPRALAPMGDALLSVGGAGRAVRLERGAGVVDVVVGYLQPSGAPGLAAFAPLLNDARGIAFDPIALALVITEAGTGTLRIIDVDVDDDGVTDDPARWTSASIDTALVTPAGIAYDVVDDSFVIAEEDNHCVRRVDRGGVVQATVAGVCGTRGSFRGFLNRPDHVALSPTSGALYVADTDNHRVLRVVDDQIDVVIGDGSVSSAGEGSPARLFPVNAPRQLALDEHGNLFVTSTTTVRLVANVDGDDDADGDDRVFTVYGGGDRAAFPESSTLCMSALALADGHVFAADTCQGFVIEIERERGP
ncbi:MAG: hypothetical protein Q8O67_06230 [Deltaproteobacteria bacterium]|nr:hypothetical protein [Deltaproteobacteria bacterium]